MSKLNEKWERVIDGILSGKMTDAQAYIAAGYSPGGAEVSISRLLNNAKFKKRLAQRSEKIHKKVDITVQRLLEEEKCIAYSDFRQLFKNEALVNPESLPDEVARAVSGVDVIETTDRDGSIKRTYKYRFWSKDKSLERLEKHKGMFELDNKQQAARIFINAKVIKKGE